MGNRSHGLPRPLDRAVNYRVKRDHHLLRLESSCTMAPTDSYLILAKTRPGGQQLMKPNYRAFFALTREPFDSDLYAIRLGALALVTGDVSSENPTALR